MPESIWQLPADVRGEVLRFASEVGAELRKPPLDVNGRPSDAFALSAKAPISLREMTRHSRPFITAVTAAYIGPYNPASVGVEVKKRMRLDPQIALGLAAIKAPVMNVTRDGAWWLEGGGDDVRRLVTELVRPLIRPLFRSCLNAVEFGHQAHEKVWELRTGRGARRAASDGSDKSDRSDGSDRARTGAAGAFYAYRKLKDLEPGTFELFADEHGRYAGLRQPHMDGPIPPEKTFVMTLNKEWGNLHGRGRLDAAYEPWYWSSVIYMFANRYFERKADPVIKAHGPAEIRLDPQTGAEENTLDSLNGSLGSLRSSGSIALPDERDEHGNRRWDVEYLLDDQRGEMFRKYIEHLDAKKLRALFVPERSLTQDGAVGSQAAARQYADTFLLMEAGLLQDIVGQVNAFVVRPLVEANFGPAALDDGLRLATTGISRQNEEILADVLRLAVEAEKNGGKLAELIDRMKLLEELNVPVKESTTDKH
ncbi:MAG: hypothetical protein ABIF82_03555 [Planctomycetota bacterium]